MKHALVEVAIVAKHEFIEITVDVLAAQAVRDAEAPSFHQRIKRDGLTCTTDAVCHLADDARIVPIAGQFRIGRVSVCNQRGSALHVGLYESFDRPGGLLAIMAGDAAKER